MVNSFESPWYNLWWTQSWITSFKGYEDSFFIFSLYLLSLKPSLFKILSLHEFSLSKNLIDQWRVQILRQISILDNPRRSPGFILLGSIIDNFFIYNFYIWSGLWRDTIVCIRCWVEYLIFKIHKSKRNIDFYIWISHR